MQNFKKTKIVATLGPTSSNEQLLTKMVKAGVNVVRLNFSHGDYNSHKESIDIVRRVSKNLDQPIAVLKDISGSIAIISSSVKFFTLIIILLSPPVSSIS